MKFLIAVFSVAVAICVVQCSEQFELYEPPQPSGRIVGGEIVRPHSIGYQVALRVTEFGQNRLCGASILSPTWLVTAAHCVDNAESLVAFIGAHNITDPNEDNLRVRIPLSSIVVHRRWSTSTLQNDIAVLRLPDPLQFSTSIYAIALPNLRQLANSFLDLNARASGWGFYDRDNLISPVLRSVAMKVVANSVCATRYEDTTRITRSQLCTSGAGPRSTCSGDSGGPLAIPQADAQGRASWLLIGIISFGNSQTCIEQDPLVYTRVTAYARWISQRTGIPLAS